MTNLEWVNELARLPEIVGVTSRSSPADESPVVQRESHLHTKRRNEVVDSPIYENTL